MQLIRGTTPTITVNIKDDIDLSQISQMWCYIYQGGVVKVDKDITDISRIDYDERQIFLRLSQEDTLGLIEGNALFQIRLLMRDDTALATLATQISIAEVYKGGEISE